MHPRDHDPGELYTVEQAARVLGRTPGRAREMLKTVRRSIERHGGP